jgi:hypothetical protein
VVDPTCTEQGYTKHTCTRCDDSYTDNVTEALGHNYVEQSRTEATCTESGQIISKCTRCGDTQTEELPALGHDYKTEVVDPTCTEQGYTKHTCTRCDDSYTDNVTEALGHNYVELSRTEATCTESGQIISKCTRCGDTQTEELPALGHDYKPEVVEPTCTEQGYTKHICSRCDDSYTDNETPALGHDYEAEVIAPTCTEQGYTKHTCSRCDESYTDNETPALGHIWDDGVVTKEPTLNEKGEKTFICTVCGATKTEAMDQLVEQDVFFTVPSVSIVYGKNFNTVINQAYNFSENGGALTYTSSDETVATVDSQGKVTVLGAGKTTITVTAATVPYVYAETAASYQLTVNKAQLTVTAQNATIVYGTEAANNGYTVTGLVAGETAEQVLSGEAVYTYDGYQQGSDVGEYAITITGLTANNYEITFVPGGLTVSKAQLTVTAQNATIVYGAEAANNGYTVTGLVTGETAEQVLSGEAVYAYDGYQQGGDVGEYAITITGLTANNYEITFVPGVLTVNKAQLTVTAQNATIVYGAEAANNGYTVTGLITDETAEQALSGEAVYTYGGYRQSSEVGEYAITITGLTANNYEITFVPGVLTVNKAQLTVTAQNATIVYGTEAANNGYTVTGLVAGEAAEQALSGEAVYTYGGYRQGDTVGQYDITLTGFTANNYEVTFVSGVLTVEKATEYSLALNEDLLTQRAGTVVPVTGTLTPQDNTATIQVEYKVDEVWSSAVPQSKGTYDVRAWLASSENIVVSEIPIYTESVLTVKSANFIGAGTDDENKMEIDASVNENGAIELDMTQEELDQVIKNASSSSTLTVDLTATELPEDVKKASDVILPAELLTELQEKTDVTSVSVKAKDAEITMSQEVLNTVSQEIQGTQTPEGGSAKLNISLKAVEDKEDLTPLQQEALNSISVDAVVLDLKLTVDYFNASGEKADTKELHELNGNVTVRAAFTPTEDMTNRRVVVCYVDDAGSVTYQLATYADGFVTFTTNHFSVYIITTEAISNGESTGTVGGGGGGGAATTTYSITAPTASHGSVSISSGTSAAGASVTITVTPEDGYKLDTLTATDASGNELTLNQNADGTYSFTMPASKVSVTCSFAEAMTDSPDVGIYFTDVTEQDYYYDAVRWAVTSGVTSGTSDTTFSPNASCTRAQMVMFLWRASGSPAPASQNNPFADVSADSYYYSAVLWAVEQGITSGTSDTTFSPDATVTRAQTVTFLYNAAGKPEVSGSSFDDVDSGSYYAKAVAWAVEQGITSGTGTNTFSPDNNCTRAQIVTFLYKNMTK